MYLLGAATSYIILPPPRKYQLVAALATTLQPSRNLHVGDVVLMYDTNSKRGVWPKALVTDTFPDKDGVARRVRVRTANSSFLRDL